MRIHSPSRLASRLAPRFGLLLALTLAAGACVHSAPPSPDRPPPVAPDLRGLRVMVLPAQGSATAPPPAHMDDEIRFWLGDHAPSVRWVFPAALRADIQRSPELDDIVLEHLPVAVFSAAQVRRIGDPLFGDLSRLGAVANTRFALLPVTAAYVPSDSLPGRVEVAAALIDTMGGEVLWYGIVAGDRGAPGDPKVVASAARALAHALVR